MKLNEPINQTKENKETRTVTDKREKISSHDEFLKSVDDSTIDQLFDSVIRETETTEDEKLRDCLDQIEIRFDFL